MKEKKTIWDFDLSSVEQLKKLARSLGVKIETTEDISVLAKPVPVGRLVAPNCFATQAMEGCDGDTEGRPSDLTIRRYERFAAGGAGVIWSEAIAAVPEGRANPRQLWLNDKSKDLFAKMLKCARSRTAEVFGPDHRPIIVAQLTHSGRYSKPTGLPEPMIPQHDPYRDVMVPQNPPDKKAKKKLPPDYPVLTDEYLDNLQDAYIKAAKMAFEVGFNAVDVKSCHGYLINELFACYNRKGKYGGSFENRTRMLWECVDKIHESLGSDKMVTARLGLYDAIPYPYGWAVDKNDYRKPDLTEPKKLVAMLVERGVKSHLDPAEFRSTWGVATEAVIHTPAHEVVLLQRSGGKMGSGPGKTTGWVHSLVLHRAKVEMIANAAYRRIDDQGLHISVGDEDRLVDCDSIVLCAGQVSINSLAGELKAGDRSVHLIGGASFAGELDAQRAIEEGTLLGARL